MTHYLSCQNLSKSYHSKVLFEDISFSICQKDRIGLVGKNGSGKTTLLKILCGLEKSDSGLVSLQKGLTLGYVPQTCDFPKRNPFDVLLESLEQDHSKTDYEKENLIFSTLNYFGFSKDMTDASILSGGWKKRLAFAKEWIQSPDLLFLDEPTNHLDLEGLLFLEKFLQKKVMTYLLVSHDRYFLQHTTNRIIEIDFAYPKGVFSIEGSYSHFLQKKEEFLQGQQTQERSLAAKVRHEKGWLAKSPKARTTKSKSRIEESLGLIEDLSLLQRKNSSLKSQIEFLATKRETKKLLVAKNLQKTLGSRVLFDHLDLLLSPGTRLGLLGPNGSGKTTLLRILQGEMLPDQGTVKRADGLKIVYFDQHRVQISPHVTLREALSPNGDFVMFHGQSIHVNGWCKRFLFSPDLLNRPIETLSGGERARIQIAHLMLQPADILLLDEPTNDLDIPTLEVLEESLLEFPGAIVLITHDRCMMDRICNTLLVLDTQTIYADYSQYEKSISFPEAKRNTKDVSKPKEKKKLSYKEQVEYEQIEGKIDALEKEVKELYELLEKISPENREEVEAICLSVSIKENQIEQLYIRFEELDKKSLF